MTTILFSLKTDHLSKPNKTFSMQTSQSCVPSASTIQATLYPVSIARRTEAWLRDDRIIQWRPINSWITMAQFAINKAFSLANPTRRCCLLLLGLNNCLKCLDGNWSGKWQGKNTRHYCASSYRYQLKRTTSHFKASLATGGGEEQAVWSRLERAANWSGM